MSRRVPGPGLLAVLAAGMLLSACANTPPTPEWQMNAKGALERAQEAYLSGDARVEGAEFARARQEVSRTGRADLLARAELARCATRVASLVLEPCAAFAALEPDASAPERAYASYLAGRATVQEAALLPSQHRAAATAAVVTASTLQALEDPLARLVAAGVAVQTGRADGTAVAAAVETASAQGWRRPLLAWLGVQARRAEQAGDTTELARVRRREALVTGGR